MWRVRKSKTWKVSKMECNRSNIRVQTAPSKFYKLYQDRGIYDAYGLSICFLFSIIPKTCTVIPDSVIHHQYKYYQLPTTSNHSSPFLVTGSHDLTSSYLTHFHDLTLSSHLIPSHSSHHPPWTLTPVPPWPPSSPPSAPSSPSAPRPPTGAADPTTQKNSSATQTPVP